MDSAWTKAIQFTLDYEGGYDNNQYDRGGETFRGISRNNWPGWQGWKFIDEVKKVMPTTFADEIYKSNDLLDAVKEFYRVNFWEQINGDELPGKVAVSLFDFAVNSGVRRAVRTLQLSLNVYVDGGIGPKTVKAAYDAGKPGLIKFLAYRTKLLHEIMDADPSQERWALNWFCRMFRLSAIVLEGPDVEFNGASH